MEHSCAYQNCFKPGVVPRVGLWWCEEHAPTPPGPRFASPKPPRCSAAAGVADGPANVIPLHKRRRRTK
jgi:hypothetical protein